MYRLYWIRFVTERAKLVHKKTYDDIIGSLELTKTYINKESLNIEAAYGVPIKVDPYYKQIPHIDGIDIVVDVVCKVKDLPIHQVLSKHRDRELSYARKFISYICVELGYCETDIAKKTGIDRAAVYNQTKTLKDLMDTRKDIMTDYEDIVYQVKQELKTILEP